MGECLRTQMHQRPYIDAADGRAAEIQGRRGGMLMNRPAPSAELVVTGIAAAVMCLYLTAPAVAQICTPDWEIISSPSVGGNNNVLTGVAVIADDDAWAVGYAYTVNQAETLTLHWDGVRWTIVPSPSPTTQSLLLGVSASASDDVWAVGFAVSPPSILIEHWDGSRWTVVPGPDLAEGPRLNAVTALARDDAWAVGQTGPLAESSDPLFAHWDGQGWTVVPSPPDAAGRLAITAIATDDIWAAGPSRLRDNSALFTHWDGASWTVVPNPTFPDFVAIYGISAIAPNDVWAFGRLQGHVCEDTCTYWEYGIVERWDGSTWQRGEPPPSSSGLGAVTAQSAQSIWVIGSDGTDRVVSRWDGARWTRVPSLPGLGSLASTPSGDVWAVGYIRASTWRTLTVRYFCR